MLSDYDRGAMGLVVLYDVMIMRALCNYISSNSLPLLYILDTRSSTTSGPGPVVVVELLII